MKNLFTAFPLLLLSLTPSALAERPNIVFFFADDQTTSTLGCYGNDVVQTPNLSTHWLVEASRFS